jgi:putative heme-binding domain-containing protein
MLIYQGGTWPKEYHGAMLTCNLHGNRINMDKLVREGCGYTGKHAPDFMKAKDKWFRGIDLLTGPDGNVFVADWSDTGECHDNDGVHRTSGRIYKIVYGEPQKAEPFDLAKLDKDAAWKLEQEHKHNNWWTRMALHLRLETTSGMKHRSIAGLGERLEKYVPVDMQRSVIKELWTALPQPERDIVESFPNAEQFERKMLSRLETWASTEADGLERLHLASALQRLPLEARWPIATALAQHEEDANDRQQPLMIWYGIEPAVAADPMKGVEFIAKAKIPTVRRLVARRIAEDIEKQPAAVDALVALMTKEAAVREDILAGMAAGLEGFSTAKKPAGWSDGAVEKWISEIPAPQNSNTPSLRSLVSQLSLTFGSGRATDELIAIVKNAEGDANARRNAFTGLTRSAKPELLPIVRGLINDKVLGTAARSALAAYDDPNIPKALLSPWPQRSEEQQAATVATLVTRPSYAHALLDAVKSGQVPVAVITPYQARAIRSLNDADLTTKLTAVWGELRDTPEAKKAELADWTKKLTPERLAKGEAAKGKVVFSSICGACHKLYGEGGMIGPDLTGGDRHKLTYLLENTIDPSAIVPADYRMSVFKLKDGRTLTGVIPAQTERSITIQTPAEKLTIEKSQIAEQQQLPMSLMPEGLLTALGEENVVHLLRYLMSDGPVK